VTRTRGGSGWEDEPLPACGAVFRSASSGGGRAVVVLMLARAAVRRLLTAGATP
jgi:hypothetical protein